MQSIELFNGALKFNIHLFIINIVVLFHFFLSYFFLCYKRGYKVDFWHFTIFLGYILPFNIIYPFAASDLNYNTIGSKIYLIQNSVDKAYLITIIGYFFTYVGFYYHDFTRKNSVLYKISNNINSIFTELMYFSIKSKISFRIIYFFSLFLVMLFLVRVVSIYGFSFHIRAVALSDASLRPLFNFIIMSIVPITVTISIIRYYHNRNKVTLIGVLILVTTLVMSGSRGAIFGPILTAFVIFIISKRKDIKLSKLITVGSLLLILVIYLGELRNGHSSLINAFAVFLPKIFYGNNFSDIRDFAWILTYWDGEYIKGKSYFAALLSFIPRSISDFREIWSISVYTSNLVGLDPNIHAGLRPGKFGEVYFNFGILGVSVLGFLTGYLLRFTDVKIKIDITENKNVNYIRLYSLTTFYSLISILFITSSFWKFYILIFIILLGYFSRHILKNIH